MSALYYIQHKMELWENNTPRLPIGSVHAVYLGTRQNAIAIYLLVPGNISCGSLLSDILNSTQIGNMYALFKKRFPSDLKGF